MKIPAWLEQALADDPETLAFLRAVEDEPDLAEGETEVALVRRAPGLEVDAVFCSSGSRFTPHPPSA